MDEVDHVNNCISDVHKYIMSNCAEDMSDDELDEVISERIKKYVAYWECRPFAQEECERIRRSIQSKIDVTIEPGFLLSTDHKPWFKETFDKSDKKFWNRYYKFLCCKKEPLPKASIHELDRITNEIMDNAADPNKEDQAPRYGLVIGDVQSGKTNTYIGLINKAADAGYRTFIILTGVTESLRSQTQRRIDEGFRGIESSSVNGIESSKKVGVGKIGDAGNVYSFTTTNSDFNRRIARNSYFPLDKQMPVVLVCKKNKNILDSIYRWLNIPDNLENGKINSRLLIIDDEADNASIDTSSQDGDITAINKGIRNILNLFKTHTYIGFTATPYANIFIDHAAVDKNHGKDLFPSDFICCMESSSDYIGAKDIFLEEGRYRKTMLRHNDDAEKEISVSHSKNKTIEILPESLENALYCFMLAITIRNIQGAGNEPASMLVNMSRYIDVHGNIYGVISDIFNNNHKEIVLNIGIDDSLNNSAVKRLYGVWASEYKEYCLDNNISWQDIKEHLEGSVNEIEIIVINSEDSNKLDYVKNPSRKVVVIGGDALSRGLTLEGLMISYFYRQSKSYDTLMQMGRWFGYRPGYAELCRIWIRREIADWYGYIAEVTEQLRGEIKEMNAQGKTPEEFGLYVEQDIRGFFVTSRTKMRHTGEMKRHFNLCSSQISTHKIYIDENSVIKNCNAVKELLNSAQNQESVKMSTYGNLIWTDISKDVILKFIQNIVIKDEHLDPESLCEAIRNAPELDAWDIAIMHGNSEKTLPSTESFKMVVRNKYIESKINGKKCICLNNRRLISQNDFQEGLSEEECTRLNNTNSTKGEKRFLNTNRKPLLAIYPLDVTSNKDDFEEKSPEVRRRLIDIESSGKVLMGFAFAFPQLNGNYESSKKEIKYVINSVQMSLDDEYRW